MASEGIPIKFSLDQAGLNDMGKQFRKQVETATMRGHMAGLKAGFSVSRLDKQFQELARNYTATSHRLQVDSLSKIEKLRHEQERRVSKTKDVKEQQKIWKFYDLQIKNVERLTRRQMKEESGGVVEILKKREKSAKEISKIREESAKLAGDSLSGGLGKAGTNLMGLAQNLRGGNFRGIGQNVTGLAKQAQGVAMQGQASMAVAGNTAGSASMGKMAMMLGKVAGPLGLVAASIGAVVLVLAKAFGQMQDMNKEILESASALDVASMASGELLVGLEDIRKVSTRLATDFKQNLSDKEIREVLFAFNEANLTFKELTKNTKGSADRQRELTETIKNTTAVARVLGVKSSEFATVQAKMMDEQGVGLDMIQGQFASVAQQAQNSGFKTKNFYQTVLEATSGMALYNARVAEAGNLLVMLGKVLGTDMASETVKELSKGFKSEGIAESFKRVLKTGQKNTKEIFQREAVVASKQFLNTLSQDGQNVLGNILGIDLNGSADQNANAISKALGGLNAKQLTDIKGQLIKSEEFPRESVKKITALVELGQAAKGDRVAMARAMNHLGPGGVLQMQLKAVQGVLGTTKKFHEMSTFEELKALEDVGGFSAEQIERLKEISSQAHGSWGQLEDLKKLGYQGEANAIKQVKQFGAYIDKNGEIVSASLDSTESSIKKGTERQVSSAEQLIGMQMAFNKGEMEPAMKEAEAISQQQAMATLKMSDILERGVVAILEEIAGLLLPIVSWVTGDLTASERETRTQALKEVSSEKESTRKNLLGNLGKISELDRVISTTVGVTKDQALKDRVALLVEQQALEEKMKTLDTERDSLLNMQSKGVAFFGLGTENDITRKDISTVEGMRATAMGEGEETGASGLEYAALLTPYAIPALVEIAYADIEASSKNQKKTKEATEETRDLIKSSQASTAFVGTDIARDLGYGGGTETQSLQALGQKAVREGKSGQFLQALKMSGFNTTQQSTITSSMIEESKSVASEKGKSGGNVFNFHGGSSAEIITHFENLQNQGII